MAIYQVVNKKEVKKIAGNGASRIATLDKLGIVKSSDTNYKISVDSATGIMTANGLQSHVEDTGIHVLPADKIRWDAGGQGTVKSTDNSVKDLVTVSMAELEALISAKQLVPGTNYHVPEDGGDRDSLAVGNPNLLINSDFRSPINQRGLTSYTSVSTSIYTIDRWAVGTPQMNVKVNSGSITVTNNHTGVRHFYQPIENWLPVGTYILSIKVKSITGRFKLGYSKNLLTNHLSPEYFSTPGVHTMQIESDGSVSSCNVLPDPGTIIDIEWMKLEVGKIATPFSPRPYAQEFQMCQRYYAEVGGSDVKVGYGAAGSTSDTYIECPLPQTMRVVPSIVHENGYMRLWDGANVVEIISTTGVQSGNVIRYSQTQYNTNTNVKTVQLRVTFGSAMLTQGKFYHFLVGGSSTFTKFAFDAEIHV